MDRRLKKGKHCGQHSGDVGIQAWQDKERVTMSSIYHKEEMCLKPNKANTEETKTTVV
jgi:hypothetical protein